MMTRMTINEIQDEIIEVFAFNPVWWHCLVFVVAGILGTSRMILRQHTLLQVVVGFLVGIVCAITGIIFL